VNNLELNPEFIIAILRILGIILQIIGVALLFREKWP